MPGEKLGFGSGRHLAAVLPSITSELRYPLGFFNEGLVILQGGGYRFVLNLGLV
ncbi:hypothetical protein [Marinobacter subterrani]|uniref:hypothetical protein n=1 Tax=Marinobacter subterrani TaxID=1658765 RepID=UPI003081141D